MDNLRGRLSACIQRQVNKDLEDPKSRVNRRNIPMHILFWTFVVFLLYLFYKAFAH